QPGTTSYQKVWERTPPLQQPTHRALPETPLSTPPSENATFARQRNPVTPTSSSSAAASPASASLSTPRAGGCPSPLSNAVTSPPEPAVGVANSPTAACATSPGQPWRLRGDPPSNAAVACPPPPRRTSDHRRLTNTIAPHLIRPLPMISPPHPAIGRTEAAVTSTGFHAGDVPRRLARTPKGLLPRPRRGSAAAVRRLAPTTAREGLRGGL